MDQFMYVYNNNTITSSVVSLMQGLGISKCDQLYPDKNHYLQETGSNRPTEKNLRKHFIVERTYMYVY